jgi:hypothetical protein
LQSGTVRSPKDPVPISGSFYPIFDLVDNNERQVLQAAFKEYIDTGNVAYKTSNTYLPTDVFGAPKMLNGWDRYISTTRGQIFKSTYDLNQM